jgi:hypothetical protein
MTYSGKLPYAPGGRARLGIRRLSGAARSGYHRSLRGLVTRPSVR